MLVLDESTWRERAAAHDARAGEFTRDHLARRARGEKHPVFDFLFDYYPVRPSHLHRWHPGVGVALAGDAPQRGWRDYTELDDGTVAADVGGFLARHGHALSRIRRLLEATAARPAHFDCFGLHEWAMVYRTDRPRHDLPLRLGAQGTDEVVESHQLRCTHFDAFRFFTEPARPLNITPLTRADQPEREQCGCLHATMDLYKWAWKMGPLVPGELWLDTLDLAWRARVLDMEASPYDCRGLGFGVVAVETTEGKAEYVARQRELAAEGRTLRSRLVAVLEAAGAR